MKDGFVVLLILLCCSFAEAGAGQANAPDKAPNPLEQTLMAAENSFVVAVKKGDISFFKSTMTDDFAYVGVDGQLATRKERIDELSTGGTDLRPYDMKVVTAGDGAGIVTYDVVVHVPPAEDQGPQPRYQHISTVWVKQGDGWKMKFQQTTASHWGDW